jgi:MbtH protein
MTNPFDNPDADFLVLVNDEGQYSLWPTFREIPGGWTAVMAGKRTECLDWIDSNWTDLRARSLAAVMLPQRHGPTGSRC